MAAWIQNGRQNGQNSFLNLISFCWLNILTLIFIKCYKNNATYMKVKGIYNFFVFRENKMAAGAKNGPIWTKKSVFQLFKLIYAYSLSLI